MTAMAQSAPHVSPRPDGQWVKLARELGMMLIAAILSAVLAALATYWFTQRLNKESLVQQQYVSSIQEFSTTGSKVDSAIADLGDTIIDGDDLAESKKEARQALSAHAAAATALIPLMGKENVEAYLKGVSELRLLVDATNDVPEAQSTTKGRNALINNRLAVIEDARSRIYN